MSSSHFRLSIPPEELVEIKDHLGEKIALYFAFLQYYFISLAFPAGLGSIFWLCGLTYSPYYSAALCAWSVVFVERWRIKERELAVEWGTYGVHEVETQRAEFVGSSQIVDPVSGVQKDYFPFARTLLRQLASVPVLLGFVGVLSILISIIYSIETIVGEVYDGPGKRFAVSISAALKQRKDTDSRCADAYPDCAIRWCRTASDRAVSTPNGRMLLPSLLTSRC